MRAVICQITEEERSLIDRRTISIPLPTHRLASTALLALKVDTELSPFVQRTLLLDSSDYKPRSDSVNGQEGSILRDEGTINLLPTRVSEDEGTVLRTEYRATTNRMLRVAVNGFMESLGVVLGVMEELDLDVLLTSRD